MWTTNGEKQAIAALNIFEQVRSFFLQNSKWKTAPDSVVRIIAFKSEKEFKPYRFNEGGFAYYMNSRKFDYIVMQDIDPQHYQAVMHEYTHLMVEHEKLKLPVWLNEGVADVYSSLEAKGEQAMVGRSLPGNILVLANQRWLDLDTLFEVGQDSPYYNEKDKMSIFYAESWALTHMLALSEEYAPSFSKFLPAVASGTPAAAALHSVYGKTLPQVTRDLRAYLNRSSLRAAVFDTKLRKSDLEPETSELSEFAVDLALTDLLACHKQHWAEASERLTKLAAGYPASADVQESLGYLALYQQNSPKAAEYFKTALAQGSKSPTMLADYAQLLNQSGAPAGQILPVLQQLVEIKPDDQDAWFNIGATAIRAGQYGSAPGALGHIKTVKDDRAFALFSMEAHCSWQLKDLAGARSLAQKAMRYAKTPEQVWQASNLLGQLDASERQNTPQPVIPAAVPAPAPSDPAPDRPILTHKRQLPRDQPSIHSSTPLQHVEAVAKSFDCDSKTHRLRVIVDSREMVFALEDPSQVIVRNMPNGHLDLQCGPQKPFKVGIFYSPAAQLATANGAIRELVF